MGKNFDELIVGFIGENIICDRYIREYYKFEFLSLPDDQHESKEKVTNLTHIYMQILLI